MELLTVSIGGMGRPEGEGDQMKDMVRVRIDRTFAVDQSFVKVGRQEAMEYRPFQWLGGLSTSPCISRRRCPV